MHGLLCLLLFAGALHVDLDGLIQHRVVDLVHLWSDRRGRQSSRLLGGTRADAPACPARDVRLASTYAVVVFSVLVQGLTVRQLLSYNGVGEHAE
jgi:NhaP-type Na+/H+ or K+/H+ antiporter